MKAPKKWYIPVTQENQAELNTWWRMKATKSKWIWKEGKEEDFLPISALLLSKHPYDNSYYYYAGEDSFRLTYTSYKKITLEQFRQITNPQPMKHPEKWYIPVTEENHAELEPWWQTKTKESGWTNLRKGTLLLSVHPADDSYYWSGSEKGLGLFCPSYQEITLEEFRQITNPNQTQTTMTKQIQISRELLNEYYEAATSPQKAYLSEHFKLDGRTTDEAIRGLHDMACKDWKPKIKKNHPDCFPEDSKYFDFSEFANGNNNRIVSGDICESLGLIPGFIRVRYNKHNPETHHRSFYLDSDYNWELVQDGTEDGRPVMVLIPTKKSSE